MNYRIKEIEKEDIYDYYRIHVYSWKETYNEIISSDLLDKNIYELDQIVEKQKNKFEQIKREEPDYKRFILYINDEPVGIFAICKSREEKYNNSGELGCLYLLKKAQKKGYGKIMFESAKEELKKLGFKDMIIYCLKDNPTTKFYEYEGGKLMYSIKKNIGKQNLIENIYYYEKI